MVCIHTYIGGVGGKGGKRREMGIEIERSELGGLGVSPKKKR